MIKIQNPKRETFKDLSKRPYSETGEVDQLVKAVLDDVRKRGDAALFEYSQKFDKVELRELAVEESAPSLAPELCVAISIAARNITTFHKAQIARVNQDLEEGREVIETQAGVKCWRRSVAISPVGLYIPAGSAPLFSTVLMLGIPAMIAGCKDIVLCSSPNCEGKIAQEVLYCAKLLGIKKIFAVGGAQAIAAMAYGTQTIPAVAKIFGPGNQYVTAAKKLVLSDGVGIDMLAGPSELLVIADESAEPRFVAADLLSQAEHGADSQVILLSDSESIIDQVMQQLEQQLALLPRREIAAASLANSKAILFENLGEAMNFSNVYAPEHLIIATANAQLLAERVENAGSVFLGNYTPESAGDYASGTNHVLPTAANARHCGGVSLASFLKEITFQEISKEGIEQLGQTIIAMAKAEGLEAHSQAVAVRIKEQS